MRTIHRVTASALAAGSLLAAYLLTAAAAAAGPVQPSEHPGFPELGPVTALAAPSSTIVTTNQARYSLP